MFFSECEVRYVLGCIELLLRSGKSAMDCRQDVHDAYNQRIDAGNTRWRGARPTCRAGTRTRRAA